MKKTITVILAVAVSTLLAYDTARFGGYTGGGASKPKYGAAAARASVKNPIRAQMLLARSVEIGDNTCPKCRGVFTVEE